VPSDRGNAAPVLPRWISDPGASDFASPERLAFEATSGERGDGLLGYMKPFGRFIHALELLYGADQWTPRLAVLPWWPGDWRPGRRYDPSAYEVPPDGPPAWLRAAVEAYQAENDERTGQVAAKTLVSENHAAMLVRTGRAGT
jgi:hypothetical protein